MSAGSVSVAAIPGRRTTVRVAVIGDRGTSKSSLITAAVSEIFPESVSPVLPPTRLPADYYPDGVPSRSLTLHLVWKVKAPLIVVGCKLDLCDEHFLGSLELVMAPIMQQFREIETCIECSAANLVQGLIFAANGQKKKGESKDTDVQIFQGLLIFQVNWNGSDGVWKLQIDFQNLRRAPKTYTNRWKLTLVAPPRQGCWSFSSSHWRLINNNLRCYDLAMELASKTTGR
ncbi:hypothetical protein L1987_82897 [Smallanthus sonchifolius]|uniref:Uncharacterized protein n=1 Tax=Smallanthus sonchifolius TaxID=185202 RepID=A0ACB8YBX8_9ASTR|nr:hypothetical protein L1987_82897 [Smallanthus sonchifolius]